MGKSTQMQNKNSENSFYLIKTCGTITLLLNHENFFERKFFNGDIVRKDAKN